MRPKTKIFPLLFCVRSESQFDDLALIPLNQLVRQTSVHADFWSIACSKGSAGKTQFSGGLLMSMTCKATIRLICEYLEGRLAPQVASEVQRHLGQCANCRTIFDAAALTLEVYFDREVESEEPHHSRVA